MSRRTNRDPRGGASCVYFVQSCPAKKKEKKKERENENSKEGDFCSRHFRRFRERVINLLEEEEGGDQKVIRIARRKRILR